jgi:hypothetical protein
MRFEIAQFGLDNSIALSRRDVLNFQHTKKYIVDEQDLAGADLGGWYHSIDFLIQKKTHNKPTYCHGTKTFLYVLDFHQ